MNESTKKKGVTMVGKAPFDVAMAAIAGDPEALEVAKSYMDPVTQVIPVATPAPKKSALELAHEAMRRRREAGEVIERLSPIEKARKNPTSLRLAVNGKCWDCIGGDSEDPNPRARIRDCGVTHCPLYSVRPFQGAKGVSGFVANSEDGSEEVDGEA